jgi:hypothetical protein
MAEKVDPRSEKMKAFYRTPQGEAHRKKISQAMKRFWARIKSQLQANERQSS